jgi:pimeloyl-ACP methyl ester carboxylesterase
MILRVGKHLAVELGDFGVRSCSVRRPEPDPAVVRAGSATPSPRGHRLEEILMTTNGKMSASPDTIVLIHGLWMTPLSWENWAKHFTELGYRVIAPAWPGMEGDIERLRRDPSNLGDLSVSKIVDHYEGIVGRLASPPIIMGHSFGGLFAQILIDRGLGAAGVAIASAPVKGVLLLPFSTLKVSFPALSNPANRHKVAPLTADQFHYAFGNTMSAEESRKIYERYAVPGPDHVLFQAGFANLNPHAETSVNFRNDDRAPLLLVAGEKDHISPPSVVEMNYKLYEKSRAVTEYKLFRGRSHYILGEAGWQEVADFVVDWAAENVAAESEA